MIRELGFDPEVYLEGKDEKGEPQPSCDDGDKVRLSGQLLRGKVHMENTSIVFTSMCAGHS